MSPRGVFVCGDAALLLLMNLAKRATLLNTNSITAAHSTE